MSGEGSDDGSFEWGADHFVPIYIANRPAEPKFSHVYRGDGRPLDKLFKEGVWPWGTDMHLGRHVFPPDSAHHYHSESGYVSTSVSKESAKLFPKTSAQEFSLLKIHWPENGVDVNAQLPELFPDLIAEDLSTMSKELEIAVRGGFPGEHIEGGWRGFIDREHLGEFDIVEHRYIDDEFVRNPNFKESLTAEAIYRSGLYRGVVGVCRTATAFAATVDFLSLRYAFEESHATGNNDYLINESARVAGGWAGATAGALAGGKLAAVACGPVFPPVGPIVCGVVGGIGGSVAGYAAGEYTATSMLFDIRRNIGRPSSLTPDQADIFHARAWSDVAGAVRTGLGVGADLFGEIFLPATVHAAEAMDDMNFDRGDEWMAGFREGGDIAEAAAVEPEAPPAPVLPDTEIGQMAYHLNALVDAQPAHPQADYLRGIANGLVAQHEQAIGASLLGSNGT